MVLLRWCVILPGLGVKQAMPAGLFVLLLLSVLFITMGGYLINDYFDMDADRINKPGKNRVGASVSVSAAMNLYYFFSALGVAAGLWVSWQVGQINYGLIFLFTVGILWYYSERYQCHPLLGNVVVALLSALSFGLVWLFDFFALRNNSEVFTSAQADFGFVSRLVLLYMAFAFLSGLFREMVKDMEDKEGDERMGCRTLAVRFGIAVARKWALASGTVMLLFLFFAQYFLIRSGFYFVSGYFTAVDILLLIILWKLKQAADIVDFSNVSGLAKLFMLLGVLSMALFCFEWMN